MVEFNPKGRSNLQEWLLRKMNFRDAGWGPTTEVVCYQFVEGRSKNMAFKKKKTTNMLTEETNQEIDHKSH